MPNVVMSQQALVEAFRGLFARQVQTRLYCDQRSALVRFGSIYMVLVGVSNFE
jgi:hypothetical protein